MINQTQEVLNAVTNQPISFPVLVLIIGFAAFLVMLIYSAFKKGEQNE